MKKTGQYAFFWALVLCVLLPGYVHATHIVGGELNYNYLGADTYEIKLTIYRDCGPGRIAPYDLVAWVGFFDDANRPVDTLKIPFPGSDTIPLTIDSDCAEAPDNICYEVAHYVDTIVLPYIPGGYQMAYQRCCWNLTVNNIKDADSNNVGLTIYARIPDVSQIAVNSNPVFNELTPPYICHGTEFEFDHAASDPDGDSIVYQIFTPLNAPRLPIGTQYEFPYPPSTFKEIRYADGFSIENVMGGDIPLQINPKTGLLLAKPKLLGQFVFGVEALEYRNGNLLGSTRRNYQINTVVCPDLTIADMKVPELFCDWKEVDFINDSKVSSKFQWNFGDPSNPGAGSNMKNPSYTYPDTGTYVVTLIAISPIDTAKCNDTIQREIHLQDRFDVNGFFKSFDCSNTVSFFGNASEIAGFENEWYWDFGDGDTSLMQSPLHSYGRTGKFEITFRAEAKKLHIGCVDSLTLQYDARDWLPDIKAFTNKTTIYKRADSALLNSLSQKAITYEWEPAETLNQTDIPNPIAKPQETTTYTITVTDELGCENKDTITIYVNPYRCGESEMFIPNAFTPNNDGENDFFRVRGEDIKELYLAIYNRWGELVYESTDVDMIHTASVGWNGTYKGKDLAPGVFVYYLKALCVGNNEFIRKGNATLIR